MSTHEEEPDHGERIDGLERWRTDLERRFAEAFPGGDHVGHCRYHDIMIEQVEERRRLRQAIQEKTISGLVWAAIVGIGYSVWEYTKAHLWRS